VCAAGRPIAYAGSHAYSRMPIGRKKERKKEKKIEEVGQSMVDTTEEGPAKYKLKRLSDGPYEI